MTIKVGSRVRSSSSGVAGRVTERIVIPEGIELVPPNPGSTKGDNDGSKYAERVDLRVEYTDGNGNKAEALIHESDAEPA